jgi:hypothetical protein
MLIRAYGEFWNPDIVEWGAPGRGNKGKLKGKCKIDDKNYHVDFWSAKGIYVLHDKFESIYVGKAFGVELGPRLRHHLTDRLAGRWDMFSWYTLSTVNKKGDVRNPGKRHLKPETVNDTLEALAILTINPILNRKRESLPNAIEVKQKDHPNPRSIRNYLEEILEKLSDE